LFIPAYNEEKTIGKVIKEARLILESQGYDSEILVVNDGSSDKTALKAKRAGAIVIDHNCNKGLAEAYRTGMRELLKLKPNFIVQTDGDGQYLAKDILKLLKPIISGKADLVLGSRFKGTIEKMPLLKRLGNKAFSRVISSISGIKISDGQTGFRAFIPEVASKINVGSDHTYTQEVILRAAKQNFKIKEIPIFFAKRIDGKSRLMSNPFEYAYRAIINLLRVYRDHQPLKFFGRTGLIVLIPGLLLGLYTIYQWLTQGFVGSVAKPVLSTLFVLLGFQIVMFGFLADIKR